MRTFTINNKRYNAKPFDFNIMCALEDNGVSMGEMFKKPMSLIRTYLSICANSDVEYAGLEIQEHLIGGGKFDEILGVIASEVEESDFFRALSQNETENVATPKKSTQK